jgi:uncharacterized protein (TIGR02145 family)
MSSVPTSIRAAVSRCVASGINTLCLFEKNYKKNNIMKKIYLLLSWLALVTTNTLQAQNDSIYLWKAGALIAKRSIKPTDLDSISFKRPAPAIANVTICSQVWATKNLDVTTYSDGTVIPQVTDPTAWANLTTGAWCYYNNDAANNATYGKLYNWYAAVGIYDAASLADPILRKKLAPTGWHVPTDAEWSNLTTCLGGVALAGGKMKETGTTHWYSPNTGATNSSGFTGLPGGYRGYNGAFYFIGDYGSWWSSSESATANAWGRSLSYNNGTVSRAFSNKTSGFSVRCLRD